MMKRNIRLFGIVALLIAAMVFVSSCSKEKKIIGKWKCTSATGNFKEFKDETVTFKEGGKCTFIDIDGEWSISKDNLTIEIDDDEVKATCDFTIDDLSSSEMSLDGTMTIKEYHYEYGYETYKIKGTMDLEKK